MTLDATHTEDQPNKTEFVAELTPYRSLGPSGFFILMGFVGVTCLISGIMFLVIGAWPVFIFMALDVLIVYFAFKLNYRDAKAIERVTVSKEFLKIEKQDPSGKIREHVLNPYWTKFQIDRHDEIGITKMQLISKGSSLIIGSFLNPDDRESFAIEFGRALSRARS